MARQARKQLADMRALEQMAERSNIVDPREVSTEELLDDGYQPRSYENELIMEPPNLPGVPTPKKGGNRSRHCGAGAMDGAFDAITPVPYVRVKGKGATPTMGLSQVRGGAKHHEAHAMGRKLRAYLENLHGGAYAEAFGAGCGAGMRGGAECAKTEEECADIGGSYFEGVCYGISDEACGTKPGPEPEPPKPEPRTAPTWTPQTHYKLGEVVYVESDDRYSDNQPGYYKAKIDSTNIILQHPGKKASNWEYLGTSYKGNGRRGAGRMRGGADCPKTEEECADMGGSYFEGECYGLTDAQCGTKPPAPGPEPGPEPGPGGCDYPEWEQRSASGPGTYYKSGDKVKLGSKAYEATTSTTNKPPSASWKEIACGGRRGAGRMVGGLMNRTGNVQQSGSYEGLGRRVAGGHCPSRDHLREDVTGKGKACGSGGKKRRAPAGASDGRRARAEIVKKVMREQGLKMIEASKYVKTHGLY